jgi:ligand-binding sensor domain-containing protein
VRSSSVDNIAAVLPRSRVLTGAAAVALAAFAAALLLARRVERVLLDSDAATRARRVRPLAFVPLRAPELTGSSLGDGTVCAVVAQGGVLTTVGGSGLDDGSRRLGVAQGLPSLRAAGAASWRGTLVLALERGRWGRVSRAGFEEAVSGWGPLEVRAFLETPAGELLLAARQGVFRAAPGAASLERLAEAPARALALAPGGVVLAGGENGLFAISGPRVQAVAAPDPWIEALGLARDGRLWAATPIGIASGPLEGPLTRHPRGADGISGVLWGGRWLFPERGIARVVALAPDGSRIAEEAPEPLRALFVASGALFGEGPSGLFRREPSGRWLLERARPVSLPRAHVNALAADGRALWAGFFDGGLARAEDPAAEGGPTFRAERGGAWGVNALLPAGGALYAATLRGTFRVTGEKTEELPGAGAAFALAATESGVAVGTAQGVYFPERRLLSAFHGLPGNQAYALASSRRSLWVGTPSGLGRVDGRKVAASVGRGEGKLPHPWVTALAERGETLWVATYGGGVARRIAHGTGEEWKTFPETAGLKVNAGALVVDPSGRVLVGTVGQGIWRSDAAQERFTRLDAALPSPDVFALALWPEEAPRWLFAGTGEGLARLPLDLGAPPTTGGDEVSR